MWEAFAAFGLGTNAVSGGANSTTPTNGFNVPASCQGGGGTVVFYDTSRPASGWQTNPNGTDTATTGAWERGDPEATDSSGAEAARHHDQRRQRPRHCAAGRRERRCERHRRRRDFDPFAGDHLAGNGHADAVVQLVPGARLERDERGLPARQRRGQHHQRGVPAARRGDRCRWRLGHARARVSTALPARRCGC